MPLKISKYIPDPGYGKGNLKAHFSKPTGYLELWDEMGKPENETEILKTARKQMNT